jgi:hypothetical protein
MTIAGEIYIDNHCIEFEADCEVCNDSIGHYEYWGQKCVDKQPDYLELYCVECWMVRGNKSRKIEANNEIINQVNEKIREVEV